MNDINQVMGKVILQDAEVYYYPNYFTKEESDTFFQELLKETIWQQDDITIFGKTMPVPRLTALYGDVDRPYRYSGISMQPHPWTPTLLIIKERIESVSKVSFTSVLLNLYRTGQDSNGWHADDEKELGVNPVIGSVSFGAERPFHMRHKQDKAIKEKILLRHGSYLLMAGETQHHWHHQIAKTKKEIEPRINLTFRVIR